MILCSFAGKGGGRGAQTVGTSVCLLGSQTVKLEILSSSTLEFANPEPGLVRRQAMAPAGRSRGFLVRRF